uniref:Activin_recp domain-containing protein n=1 Tax=Rhabditophanes sp. KR3021 TaxID=114890 RepID=A0AC35U8T2_9BILA
MTFIAAAKLHSVAVSLNSSKVSTKHESLINSPQVSPSVLLGMAIKKRRMMADNKEHDYRRELLNTGVIKCLLKYLGESRVRKQKTSLKRSFVERSYSEGQESDMATVGHTQEETSMECDDSFTHQGEEDDGFSEPCAKKSRFTTDQGIIIGCSTQQKDYPTSCIPETKFHKTCANYVNFVGANIACNRKKGDCCCRGDSITCNRDFVKFAINEPLGAALLSGRYIEDNAVSYLKASSTLIYLTSFFGLLLI